MIDTVIIVPTSLIHSRAAATLPRVHHSTTPKYTLRHTETHIPALAGEFHGAGMVDTGCCKGGHGGWCMVE